MVARVKARLRTGSAKSSGNEPQRVTVQGVVVDASRHIVTIDDELVNFTATEFRLLHFLASHPGRVYSRDQIIGKVIGDDVIVIDRNIDVHIRSVRKKLGPYRDLIETVRGVGYRFFDSGS